MKAMTVVILLVIGYILYSTFKKNKAGITLQDGTVVDENTGQVISRGKNPGYTDYLSAQLNESTPPPSKGNRGETSKFEPGTYHNKYRADNYRRR